MVTMGVWGWWWLLGLWAVAGLTAFLVAAFSLPFRKEILGIARVSGISPGKILLVQYVYEFVSACTSVVVPDGTDNAPVRLIETSCFCLCRRVCVEKSLWKSL